MQGWSSIGAPRLARDASLWSSSGNVGRMKHTVLDFVSFLDLFQLAVRY